MAYQALYRKWRPRTFDAVVGQDAITSTLKNSILKGKVSHAFLFSGPRGTGKTSCAKIFAKALNCLNLTDGEPCNQCANCVAADEGSMPDIIEIDAASNNGVDEIRDIRDKVKYAPTQGKYKVYIIDEVHMLSIGAFNALLKTLEEPPAHVVFILATTELQKVPATIISRTQRYAFKRISQADLIKRMEFILGQEQISFDQKAIAVIAQVADGGMRDALSILDQLLSYDQGKINYTDTLKITGFSAQETIEQILLAIVKQDFAQALTLSQETFAAGASTQNVLNELVSLATKVLLALKTGQVAEFLTNDYLADFPELAKQSLFKIIEDANQALVDLRYTNQQQIPYDVFLVKSCQQLDQTVNVQPNAKLEQELAELKRQVAQLAANQPVTRQQSTQVYSAPSAKAKAGSKAKDVSADKDKIFEVLLHATKDDAQRVKNVWPDLLSSFEVAQKALIEILEPVAASKTAVVLKCKYTYWFNQTNSDPELLNKIESEIERFAGQHYSVLLVAQEQWPTLRQEFIATHKDLLVQKKSPELTTEVENRPQNQDVVDKAKEMFGDIVEVKD